MGYFEAQGEVEASPEGERLAQVSHPEERRINLKELLIDPRSVKPDDVIHTVLREHRKPGAQPAPHVYHASWSYLVHHERNENSCRFSRSPEPARIIDIVERCAHEAP
jgi:hypothetical protein